MAKPYVFMTRRVSEDAIKLLQQSFELKIWEEESPVPREVLLDEVEKADGLYVMLTDRIDQEVLNKAKRLKAISTMAVGYDNIDVEMATEKGIVITNTPGVLSEATADLTFALLMDTARRLSEANRYLLHGDWKSWSPMLMAGQDVYGATLGIIGMGRIGEAVARRAKGFNMKIIYNNRNQRVEIEEALGAEYRQIDDLLQEADFIVLLTPLTKETANLIGERELNLMKSSAIFINVSRGATVDEEALYRALRDKRIWGAGLDVFRQEPIPMDNPLLSLDNIVVLPHIGSASIKTREKMAMLAAEGLRDALTGQKPQFVVNKDVYL